MVQVCTTVAILLMASSQYFGVLREWVDCSRFLVPIRFSGQLFVHFLPHVLLLRRASLLERLDYRCRQFFQRPFNHLGRNYLNRCAVLPDSLS